MLDFWKIAMRPGKPLIFGRLGALAADRPAGQSGLDAGLRDPVPASPPSPRCSAPRPKHRLLAATARSELKANDTRQDYIRATLERRDGELWATPFPIQDSSMLSALARADALIVRPPHAPAAAAGGHLWKSCRWTSV